MTHWQPTTEEMQAQLRHLENQRQKQAKQGDGDDGHSRRLVQAEIERLKYSIRSRA